MCCTRLAGNAGPKNRQNSSSGYHRTTLSDYIFATKARIDNRKKNLTRMLANTQRDGRPADYRWRPLFNAAKFG